MHLHFHCWHFSFHYCLIQKSNYTLIFKKMCFYPARLRPEPEVFTEVNFTFVITSFLCALKIALKVIELKHLWLIQSVDMPVLRTCLTCNEYSWATENQTQYQVWDFSLTWVLVHEMAKLIVTYLFHASHSAPFLQHNLQLKWYVIRQHVPKFIEGCPVLNTAM